MNTFFTADTHFQHDAIRHYCQRPFADVDEMDNSLIALWNGVVGKRDVIYHLGDVFFGDEDRALGLLQRLNGKKFLVPGNHDTPKRIAVLERVFEILPPLVSAKFSWGRGNHRVTLCHYAMQYWDRSVLGSLMFYGHTHGRYAGNRQSLDVGVDCWNFTPVRMDAILARLEELPPREDNV